MKRNPRSKWHQIRDKGDRYMTTYKPLAIRGKYHAAHTVCKSCFYILVTWPKTKVQIIKKSRKGYCSRCHRNIMYITKAEIAKMKEKANAPKTLTLSLVLVSKKPVSFVVRLQNLLKKFGKYSLEYNTTKKGGN